MSKPKRSYSQHVYKDKKKWRSAGNNKTRKNTNGGAPTLSEDNYINALNIVVDKINKLNTGASVPPGKLSKINNFTHITAELHDLPTLFELYTYLIQDIKKETEIQIPGKTQPEKIKNKVLLKFVISKIREIERKNAHPDLLNTFLYYFDLFDFPIALQLMNVYLSQLYEIFKYEIPTHQDITTILEKSLVHHKTIDEFNSDLNKDKKVYNIRTFAPDTQDSYHQAVNILNQTISQIGKPYDMKVGEFTARINNTNGTLNLNNTNNNPV
jgi:hypothetical protein